MAGPTNYFANLLINYLFRGDAMTPPATYYLALFTATPSDSGGGTEVAGGAYARLALTRNTTVWAVSTARQMGLSSSGSFVEATANWGTITAVAIFDAATAGNMLWWGPLDSAQIINAGDTFKVPASTAGLRITV